MLTAEQKAEAEKKLKNISEELALDEQTKAKISISSLIQKHLLKPSTML
jgi:hypothetical protein